VQYSHQWETTDDDADDNEAVRTSQQESRGTQVEAAARIEQGTQTGSPERSYTPPGTPPKLRRWGPRRYTTSKPSIEWRERL